MYKFDGNHAMLQKPRTKHNNTFSNQMKALMSPNEAIDPSTSSKHNEIYNGYILCFVIKKKNKQKTITFDINDD